jgi:DNA-binding protein YbaB
MLVRFVSGSSISSHRYAIRLTICQNGSFDTWCITKEVGRWKLSSDAARERIADVLGGLRDQLADMAAMREELAELRVDGRAAEGGVEVTVDARGQLVKTVVDKSFLDDHDFDEVGSYVTEAAQRAATLAARRVAELMAPITERHKRFPSFSEIVEGLPEPRDVMPPGLEMFAAPATSQEGASVVSVGGDYDEGGEGGDFPKVRELS